MSNARNNKKGTNMNIGNTAKNQKQAPSYATQKGSSYFALDGSPDQHLFKGIDKNLFKLEEEVAFFSFAIKEIEDITK